MLRRLICGVMAGMVWASTCNAANDAFTCRSRASNADAVVTTEILLGNVPAILRVPRTISKPPIVLWHGFGAPANERALVDMLPLDDVPAVKVYLGLPLFGRRAEDGGMEALKRRQDTDVASLVFEPVVVGAARELPSALKALQAIGCMKPVDPIGLFGFSAGGAAVLLALAERDVPISGAVILNASTGLSASIAAYERAIGKPYAWTESARALAQRTDAVTRARDIAAGHPALLIIQGTDDAMLTPELATALHGALSPLYAGPTARREQLMLAKGVSHNVSDAATLTDLRKWIGGWFARYLEPAGTQPGNAEADPAA